MKLFPKIFRLGRKKVIIIDKKVDTNINNNYKLKKGE